MIGIYEILVVIGEVRVNKIKEMDAETAEFVAHLLAVEFAPNTRIVVVRRFIVEKIYAFFDQRKLYADQCDAALASKRGKTLKCRDLSGIDIRCSGHGLDQELSCE